MKNNCADATCRAFGIDPNETDSSSGISLYISNSLDKFKILTSGNPASSLGVIESKPSSSNSRIVLCRP